MSWSDFLILLAGPAAVGIVWSVIFEYIPAFQYLAPKWKRAAFFAVCMVLPLAGAGLGMLTHTYPATWETVWQAVVAGGTVFAAGTMLHTRRLPDAPDGE